MAQTKVTAALLREFATTLRTEKERFETTKNSMDNELFNGFLWEDPVAHSFKERYDKGLKPLEQKLLPAMDKYQLHLDKEANIISEEWSIDVGTVAGLAGAGVGVFVGADLYKPAVNDKIKEKFKDNFKNSFKDISFIKDENSLKKEDLENAFNKKYDTDNIRIELTDEGMYSINENGKKTLLNAGYYKNGVVYLNKSEYEKWTDEEKINNAAHEYYHAYDEKIEKQRKAELKRLKKEKETISNKTHIGPNAEHNYQVGKKRITEIDNEIKKIDKLIKENNSFSGMSDACANVDSEECNRERIAYLTSVEENRARINGESAAAAFTEFKKEKLQNAAKIVRTKLL
jgi:hypothetical protein